MTDDELGDEIRQMRQTLSAVEASTARIEAQLPPLQDAVQEHHATLDGTPDQPGIKTRITLAEQSIARVRAVGYAFAGGLGTIAVGAVGLLIERWLGGR